jgi:proteasome lid subunit RPN8/RPN11
MIIYLKREHLEKMINAAKLSFPFECCGFLIGEFENRTKKINNIVRVNNVFAGMKKMNHYLIDPNEQYEVEISSKENGQNVLGIYHSHPDADATPSDYDLKWACYGYSYFILALNKNGVTDSASWVLSECRRMFINEKVKLL